MKKLLGCLAVLSVLAVAALAVGGWWLSQRLSAPFGDPRGVAVTVDVEPGTPSTGILHQLERAGVIEDARLARLWLIYGRGDPVLQAGEYSFEPPFTVDGVIDKLVAGDVVTHPVTVIEGLTLAETAAVLADAGLGDRAAFVAAMRDPAAIADLDPEAENLEGYLFPSTYHFAKRTSETEIVDTLVRTFRRNWRDHVQPKLSPRAPEGVRAVVTLASVVEKEARVDGERPVVAGVYANRLERGIALYADPTVIFALKLLGRWDGNLRRPDLQLDHPYNTYVHPGLPPGPIASPGLASLQAAAAPAEHDYIYFVSKNDGTHVFAATLAEHNRNVDRWQRRYWRQRWAEERKERSAAGDAGDGKDDGGRR
jgi:UPF0755 protein